MNRFSHTVLAAQYTHKTAEGIGKAEFENGIKCVIPSVKISGEAQQTHYNGYNILDADAALTDLNSVLGYGRVAYDNAQTTAMLKPSATYTIQYTVTGLGHNEFYTDEHSRLGFVIYSGVSGYTSVTLGPWTAMFDEGRVYTHTQSFTAPADLYDTQANYRIYAYAQRAYDVNGGHVVNNISFTDIMLVEGSYTADTMPAYEPYVGGMPAPNPKFPVQPVFAKPLIESGDTSVQCPELCAMPDGSCRDSFDTQTGTLTHRLKKAVLTGEENVYLYKINGNGIYITGVMDGSYRWNAGICTHAAVVGSQTLNGIRLGANNNAIYWFGILDTLGISTAEEFKAWLAAQYEAGTPVTIWYAVAEPENETCETTRLHQPKGHGQVVQSDGGLSVPIEVKYLTHT